VGYGIAGHAEDARRLVKMLDAVEVAQGAGRHLAGGGFRSVGRGRKGERRTGTRAQHAGDKAFFAHGDADHMRGERMVLDEAQHRKVVGQGAGG